ncbi:MAG: hypothetical protein WC304_01600 [Candidatus Gracilibacteria bacterium]|jgi:hypothetical protein
MKHKINSRFLAGGVLITASVILILALSWFLWWKYTAPAALAKILPADETLLFLELHPSSLNNEWDLLRKNWLGADITKLLELDSLGITGSEKLWNLAKNRIGVAFLGEKLDAQRFVLLMDSENPEAVLLYLRGQGFLNEKLKTENYLGREIFTYPNSHSFAFTFRGSELILAANLPDLKNVIGSMEGEITRVSETAGYRAAIAKLNPRDLGFGYFSPAFVNQLITAKLNGIENAITTPLLNLWQSGGINLIASEGGIKLTTHFILKDEYARNPLFLDSSKFNPAALQLLNAEVAKFWLVESGEKQFTHFLEATAKLNPNFGILAQGSSLGVIQKWLGNGITLQDISPLLTDTSVVGVTENGNFIGILPKTNTSNLQQKILSGKGLISAEETTVALPDTTPGYVLTPTTPTASIETNNGYSVTQLKFPQHELDFVDTDDFTIITSDNALLTKILTSYKANETGLTSLLSESDFSKGNLYYTQLPATQIPLLQPFHFTLMNLQTTADDLILDIFLGR